MSFQKSPLSPEQRFWAKVSAPDSDGCWNWNGSTSKKTGYGQFALDNKTPLLVHRIAYSLLRGEIPPKMTIDHLCRNRRCVNPDHMDICTRGENTMRGNTITAANLRKTHCGKGHPYSGENLIVKAEGFRRCRQCHAEWNRKYMRDRYREKKNAAA
jgi:hypothetical protein